jgi:hypothetical protein
MTVSNEAHSFFAPEVWSPASTSTSPISWRSSLQAESDHTAGETRRCGFFLAIATLNFVLANPRTLWFDASPHPKLNTTLMKSLLQLFLIAGILLFNTQCLNTAQKAQAKALIVQVSSQVAKNAAVAAANTAVALAQQQLAAANVKLAAAQAAVNATTSSAEMAKLSMLQLASTEAASLLQLATMQLAKLAAMDALPPTPVAPATPPTTALLGVTVTP